MNRPLNVSTPNDLEILMTRRFDAPRALVWKAMTEPDLIRRWIFTPPEWTVRVFEGRAVEGETYCWAWNGPDGRPALTLTGEMLEVKTGETVKHTQAMEMGEYGLVGELVATLRLRDDGDGTMMSMTLAFASKKARDAALASGMEHGMSAGYTRLDALLPTLSRS